MKSIEKVKPWSFFVFMEMKVIYLKESSVDEACLLYRYVKISNKMTILKINVKILLFLKYYCYIAFVSCFHA